MALSNHCISTKWSGLLTSLTAQMESILQADITIVVFGQAISIHHTISIQFEFWCGFPNTEAPLTQRTTSEGLILTDDIYASTCMFVVEAWMSRAEHA